MKILKEFFKLQSTAGIILMFSVVVSLILSNSALKDAYFTTLDIKFGLVLGNLKLIKPLILWINDGLMAIFFFLIGLELKRELVQGHLNDKENIIMPIIGALGGLILPALIFYCLNSGNEIAARGWAIPAATDIAFALGVLSLVGPRVPKSAKIFLLTLAIFDDLAAILIIALFYTEKLSLVALLCSVIFTLILFILCRKNVKRTSIYLLVGVALWFCVLNSGIHATIAGVLVALFIPIESRADKSPLHKLESCLHPWVSFLILPIFAIANSGVEIKPLLEGEIFNDITLGAGLGLFFGKQLGVFISCLIGIKLGKLKLPNGMNFSILYAVSLLTGIGFTMSLFIASLSYGGVSQTYMMQARLGIIVGSLFSAVIGYFVLKLTTRFHSQ